MRHHGRITKWRDRQGFGFVRPERGGERVFVHANAFAARTRRPVEGDHIAYDLVRDEYGRPRAANALFTRDPPAPGRPMGLVRVAIIVVAVLFAVLLFLTITGAVPFGLSAAYVGLSVYTYQTYGRDKIAACNNLTRTKERTLHALALAGGWPGAILGQAVLRHKTRKRGFQVVFWLAVLVNIGLLAALAAYRGWPTEILAELGRG